MFYLVYALLKPEHGFVSHLYHPRHRSDVVPGASKGATMLDVILLSLGLVLFVLSIGYAYACDRL